MRATLAGVRFELSSGDDAVPAVTGPVGEASLPDPVRRVLADLRPPSPAYGPHPSPLGTWSRLVEDWAHLTPQRERELLGGDVPDWASLAPSLQWWHAVQEPQPIIGDDVPRPFVCHAVGVGEVAELTHLTHGDAVHRGAVLCHLTLGEDPAVTASPSLVVDPAHGDEAVIRVRGTLVRVASRETDSVTLVFGRTVCGVPSSVVVQWRRRPEWAVAALAASSLV